MAYSNGTQSDSTQVADDPQFISRFDAFQTAVSDSFVPLHVTSDSPGDFHGRLRSTTVDGVAVTEIFASPHNVYRTPELIARNDDQYYKMNLLLGGTGLLIQDDREAFLQPGDLAIYDTSRPYSLVFDDEFRNLVLMCPKSLIDLPTDAVGQLTAVTIPGRDGVGGMVAPFLAKMSTNLEQLQSRAGVRIVRSALDLLTTVLVNELDRTDLPGSTHLTLVRHIKEYIEDHLGSPELTPTQIAAEHFISTRHLHGIFRESGTTVSSWIRQRRLERCRRDLTEPLFSDRPVSAIASRWGFSDAAHFSRVFKAAFGCSPSEMRASRTPADTDADVRRVHTC